MSENGESNATDVRSRIVELAVSYEAWATGGGRPDDGGMILRGLCSAVRRLEIETRKSDGGE